MASPIFTDFMQSALADKPAIPFRQPEGIKLIRVNAKTGLRAQDGDQDVIMEAFKPGNEPPDPFSYVGYPSAFAPGLKAKTRAPRPAGSTDKTAQTPYISRNLDGVSCLRAFNPIREPDMRAEAQAIVDDIRESLALDTEASLTGMPRTSASTS